MKVGQRENKEPRRMFQAKEEAVIGGLRNNVTNTFVICRIHEIFDKTNQEGCDGLSI